MVQGIDKSSSSDSVESGIHNIEKRVPSVYKKTCFTFRHQKMFTLTLIAIASMFAMCDQSGFPILIPSISDELDAHATIQWASTGSLIASTIVNILLGRLTDPLGKKSLFISSLSILSVFQILCFSANDKISFYVFKSISGFGQGGIISLAIIMASDMAAVEKRGQYHGLLGLFIGTGSFMGPFVSSSFVKPDNSTSWKQYFFLMGGIFMLLALFSFCVIPSELKMGNCQSRNKNSVTLGRNSSLRSFDYLGFVFFVAALVLFVIPLNSSGSEGWKWSGIRTILCILASILFFGLFIVKELKFSEIPIIPLNYFENLGIVNVLLQTFLMSVIYSSMIYYLPFLFIIVQELPLMKSAACCLSFLVPLALFSVISGFAITYFSHYKYIILAGYVLYIIGELLLLFQLRQNSNLYLIIPILIVMGSGFGLIFTPLTISAQVQSKRSEVTIVLSMRSVLKTLGNSIGVSVSYLIYASSLRAKVSIHDLAAHEKSYILSNMNKKIQLSYMFRDEQISKLGLIYSRSLFNVCVLWLPISIICFTLGLLAKDDGLQNVDDTELDVIDR